MKSPLSFLILFVSIFTALSALTAAESSEPKPKKKNPSAYFDNYWGHDPDPDMSERAFELTNPTTYYLEKDGYVIAECEDQPFNQNWVLLNEPEGFFGNGYLKYTGENLQGNHDGHNTDIHVQYQQNIQDRLLFPIRITTPGTYRARVHVIHHEKDGDNDAWINLMRTPRRATRLGGKNPGQFHWNAFGWDGTQIWDGKFNTFTFEVPGDYIVYIGGRSHGFGVDRLVLHKDDKQEIALDPSTPASARVAVSNK